MKKHLYQSFFYACLAVVFFAACERPDSELKTHTDYVTPVAGQDRSTFYWVITHLGHDGRNCSGCVTINGEKMHLDCMNYGDKCCKVSKVVLENLPSGLAATTVDTFDLTSEDFFNMPARSLNYTDGDNNRVYLNIPPQLVWRDTATLQFTFTGLSITESPLYTNE
ncbi:MAG: hypothetical protein J6S56_04925 [Bacteroidales bacterium]|nr:hypothetical protein [Bacteroidales bacterium]